MMSRKNHRNWDLPGVCLYYNRPRGCFKGDQCNFLHICVALFDDGCHCPHFCELNHDFDDYQTSEVLEQYNIDPYQDFNELLDLLSPKVEEQRFPNDNYVSEEEVDEWEEDDYDWGDQDDAVSYTSSSSHQSNYRQRRMQQQRKRKSSLASEISERSTSVANATQQEICTFHVKNGNCKHGDNCSRLHRRSRLPYQWQVRRGSQWMNTDENLNRSIESSFCDPSIEETEVNSKKFEYTINFNNLTMSRPITRHGYDKVRRLSTLATVKNYIKSMDPYCTHWVWYWKNGRAWKEYSKENRASPTDSDTLEIAYQNYLNDDSEIFDLHSSARRMYINFDDMNKKIPGKNYSVKVCRRPRPYLSGPGEQRNPEMSEGFAAKKSVTSSQDVFSPSLVKSEPLPTQKKIISATSVSVTPSDEPCEICALYLCNKCKDDESCKKLHTKSPYQWQYKSGTTWKNYDNEQNTEIEEKFCNPSEDSKSISLSSCSFEEKFETLTGTVECLEGNSIRRLSTTSTVKCQSPQLEPFCVEWMWYWKDETGKWVQYAQKNSKAMQSDVDRNTLEEAYEKYLSGGDTTCSFTTHENNYKLRFRTMVQCNLDYDTQREVRRRPRFLTMPERRRLASLAVPETWDMRGMVNSDRAKLICVDAQQQCNEYRQVESMFMKTMKDKSPRIISIKRVQNLELWEDFSKKQERMKRKNGGAIVKKLWHGTKEESVKAICRQNFDFRISGSNVGTVYGHGSYFARDARYSDSYSTPENDICRMFLARVLVGSFVTGKSEYKRPPPKHPGEPHGDLYDSCVDDVDDPSIFVTFEKSQAYPEYLIEYKRKSATSSTSMSAASSVHNVSSYGSVKAKSPAYSSKTARGAAAIKSPSGYGNAAAAAAAVTVSTGSAASVSRLNSYGSVRISNSNTTTPSQRTLKSTSTTTLYPSHSVSASVSKGSPPISHGIVRANKPSSSSNTATSSQSATATTISIPRYGVSTSSASNVRSQTPYTDNAIRGSQSLESTTAYRAPASSTATYGASASSKTSRSAAAIKSASGYGNAAAAAAVVAVSTGSAASVSVSKGSPPTSHGSVRAKKSSSSSNTPTSSQRSLRSTSTTTLYPSHSVSAGVSKGPLPASHGSVRAKTSASSSNYTATSSQSSTATATSIPRYGMSTSSASNVRFQTPYTDNAIRGSQSLQNTTAQQAADSLTATYGSSARTSAYSPSTSYTAKKMDTSVRGSSSSISSCASASKMDNTGSSSSISSRLSSIKDSKDKKCVVQ